MGEYQLQKKLDYTTRFRSVLSELPDFCALYFRAVEPTTSILTRYGYAIDLRSFFKFLTSEIDAFKNRRLARIALGEHILRGNRDKLGGMFSRRDIKHIRRPPFCESSCF